MTFKGYHDDNLYTLSVRYLGNEKLDTRIGEKEAIVLVPIPPEKTIFDKEQGVKSLDF